MNEGPLRIALVTRAGSGIGRVCAITLAEVGYAMALVAGNLTDWTKPPT